MKIYAVIGGRTFNDYELLKSELDKLQIDKIVSGGAKGADTLAERYAKEHSIPLEVFNADWDKFGKSAGYIRNEQVMTVATNVVAFWDGISKGTAHTIRIAKKQSKPVIIVDYK